MTRFMQRITIVLTVLAIAPLAEAADNAARSARAIDTEAATRAFLRAVPQARLFEHNGRTTDAYGTAMAHGNSPEDAAEEFRWNHVEIFGVAPQDLDWRGPLADERHLQPLMLDPDTGRYKFTLVYYTQRISDIPVYAADIRLLVRNEPGFPVVLARNGLRDIGGFKPNPTGVRDAAHGRDAAGAAFPTLTRFTEPRLVIWGGVDEMAVEPRVAYQFIGDNGLRAGEVAEKWLFITDGATGDILYREDRVYTVDIAGNVSALATEGIAADICEDELPEALPYALVRIGGTDVFADENGDFVIPNAGIGPVTVESHIQGQFFDIENFGGPNTVLTSEVTPPGPVDFVHNADNANEFDRAEVNVYLEANAIRDHVLFYSPDYPVIATQTGFFARVSMNSQQSGGFCPGNAQYLGDGMRFCASGSNNPNTGWSSVVHHEYGHHLVAMAGSGQGAYGEGTGDVASVLVLDDPRLGQGFFNNCNSSLRNADNNCQYSPSSCTTNCGSQIHDCGQLISGCVWSTRNELVATNPDTYRDILSDIAVNAILLHTGSSITPAITVHYVTLDDDDDTIDNGSPHYAEIDAGFGAHGMPAPELALLAFVYPDGRPSFSDPNEGAPVVVEIQSISGVLDTDSPPLLHVSINGGDFEASPLAPVAGEEARFSGTLPQAPCFATLDWFVSAQTTDGLDVTSPNNAPKGGTFETFVITDEINVLEEDFEDAVGYTVTGDVSGAASGEWELGVPAGGGARGDPAQDFDGSGQCYLTGNAPDNTDVDNGSTILTSPAFDMSAPGAQHFISYARWYSNTFGAAPNADIFVVEISNDDGASWSNLETVGPSGDEVDGGWFFVSHNVNDVLEPTAQVRVRFTASDLGSGSVVEAAIDALRVDKVVCDSVDKTPPRIIHDGGLTTNPYTGYVDPRAESSDGTAVDLGIDNVTIKFTEFVHAAGGGDLTAASFTVGGTGTGHPAVMAIDAGSNPLVHLTLSGPIPLQAWTTIIANVEDASGNAIDSLGDLGPGVDESDRVDIGFLPGDVDQGGRVEPFDLLMFRSIIQGIGGNPQGEDADFVDVDRSGSVTPFDLLAFRQLVNGSGNATRVWADETISPRP